MFFGCYSCDFAYEKPSWRLFQNESLLEKVAFSFQKKSLLEKSKEISLFSLIKHTMIFVPKSDLKTFSDFMMGSNVILSSESQFGFQC